MVALAMATPLFTSCYDDSALNEKLEDIQTEVDKLKSDLAALQAAVDNNLSVVDYKQIEGGYELTMSDGSTITILNGKDGAAGKDGKDGKNGEKIRTLKPIIDKVPELEGQDLVKKVKISGA